MSDSTNGQLLEEVMDIMARGEAPWQQTVTEEDRIALNPDAERISFQFRKALQGNTHLMETIDNRLSGDLFSSAINAKPHVGINALVKDGTFDQMLDVAEQTNGLNELRQAITMTELATKTRLTRMGFEKDAFDQVDQTMEEMTLKLAAREKQISAPQRLDKNSEFDRLVDGQNLVIEKAVDDGMSYVGTVAGEDGGTVIVKVGDHRAVAMSKARMEGDVEVGENSRFGYEKQYGHDERGRAIRDKNIELGGQRYAVIDMDDLVQQNRRSVMGKVLAVEPDAIYTKFGKDAEGRDQVVAHNPAKLDVIPALGSFATINYGADGLGKLISRDHSKGLDQQIER